MTADAEAYEIRVKAEADAEQTKLLAAAISKMDNPPWTLKLRNAKLKLYLNWPHQVVQRRLCYQLRLLQRRILSVLEAINSSRGK